MDLPIEVVSVVLVRGEDASRHFDPTPPVLRRLKCHDDTQRPEQESETKMSRGE